GASPVLHVAGDRWVVVDGGVLTSDDQGARWRARPLHAGALGADDAVLAAAFHGASGVLLDAGYRLRRPHDAGSTVAAPRAPEGLAALAQTVPSVPALAWDGGRRIAVITRAAIARTADGGASWSTPHGGWATTPSAAAFAPDGRLVAIASQG